MIAGDGGLALDRFSGWEAGDARWQVPTIEMSRPVELVVSEIAAWIAAQRQLLAGGSHPLAEWAEKDQMISLLGRASRCRGPSPHARSPANRRRLH